MLPGENLAASRLDIRIQILGTEYADTVHRSVSPSLSLSLYLTHPVPLSLPR